MPYVVFFVYLTSVCISIPVSMATRIPPACPKCAAIKKSGKLSCCAPGGAWFNNCDTSGNSNTEYTWVEGIQACRDMVSLASGKAEAQSIISVNQTTTTQVLNDDEHQNIDSSLSAYDSSTSNSKINDQLSHIVVFTNVLFIMFSNVQA